MRLDSDRFKRRPSVLSVHASTDCGFPEVKDELKQNLSCLLQNVFSTDFIIISGDFDAQVCFYRSQNVASEAHPPPHPTALTAVMVSFKFVLATYYLQQILS